MKNGTEVILKQVSKLYTDIFNIINKEFERNYNANIQFKNLMHSYSLKHELNLPIDKFKEEFCKKSSFVLISKLIFLNICTRKLLIKSINEWPNLINEFRFDELFDFIFSNKNSLQSRLFNDIRIYESLHLDNRQLNVIIDKFHSLNYDIDPGLLGKLYEQLIDIDTKKSLGSFYTPIFIVDYMLENTVDEVNILKSPFVKVLDPSCGCGYFLDKAYDLLMQKFKRNIVSLNSMYYNHEYTISSNGITQIVKGKDYWVTKNIHFHILKHCIYGADIDSFSTYITKFVLLLKDIESFSYELNVINCDSLIRYENLSNLDKEKINFWSRKFDYIIGNPPYIGTKNLNKDYKKYLLNNYSDVFKDKSDLSYCFHQRALEKVKDTGKISFIVPRYFFEGPTGMNLRCYLKNNTDIKRIIDFFGIKIFKNLGISTSILTYTRKKLYDNKIEVFKVNNKDIFNNYSLVSKLSYNTFYINQNDLKDDRWILAHPSNFKILKKISDSSNLSLKDIAYSFQGIITGYDKAFVLSSEDIHVNNIEDTVVKPWIKNSNIEKYILKKSDLKLIYADSIDDPNMFENSMRYIHKYKNKLENRRECKLGSRKWYHLQWGREEGKFNKYKMVYPYKSKQNRFAIDPDGHYFSADVYSFYIKEEYAQNISLEYLVSILNSSLYEFYFKQYGKYLGNGLYDYYPNSVMDLKIIVIKDKEVVEKKGKEIINLCRILDSSDEQKESLLYSITKLRSEIDDILYNHISLTSSEIELINEFICN
ncbi:Eco57I restriction-modification methylase domain-containing protein [Alkalithermobacter paradoxus]|uniref:site-specific DNA-methyltransferase (adenine-specific) n=1 Tax=Alkalithermobacter paradoxus TaxID=29349 RepID=A0A1V4IB11_9FIRM|nr:type IIS restriction enzyme Eco57I [[Clostridium] thermoalcaliphilum]